MKSNKNQIILILVLLMTVILALGPDVLADDVDVYRTTAQSAAMVVFDDSGSMAWPVYEIAHDYTNFMRWMRDPNGDGNTADNMAYDDEDLRCIHWWNAHTLEAEDYDEMSGVVTGTTSDDCGGGYVDNIHNNEWLKFSQVDFGDGMKKVRARVKGIDDEGPRIEFWIDDPSTGTKIGTINIGDNSSWHTETANLTQTVTGVHDLYLKFRIGDPEGELFELNWFQFAAVGWENYDRLDPNQIYLVSSPVWLGEVTFTDSEGQTRTVSTLMDVLAHSSSHNERDDWLQNTIIELKNSNGDPWRLPTAADTGEGVESGVVEIDLDVDIANLTIETVQDGTDGKYYVLFPTTTENIDGGGAVDPGYTGHGQRLTMNQDILLTNLVTDSRTGLVTDYGFLGSLRSGGYYFAGVFEKSGTPVEFTPDVASAEVEGQARAYVFATGRWLNFIKLTEDFHANTPGSPPDAPYDHQADLAWTNICDKSAGTDEPSWSSQSTTILSHNPEVNNYGGTPVGDFLKGTLSPPGEDGTEVAAIKVQFDVIDTEWCLSGTANDYVDLQDANGNSLLAIKGQEIRKNGAGGSGAAISYDGGDTWIDTKNILDKDGYTEPLNTNSIRVVWHKGQSGKTCSGSDKGFKVTGLQFTTQDLTISEAGDFYCSNSPDGYGHKIRARVAVARSAMKRVVDATSNSLNWGITAFNESPKVMEPLGTDVTVIQAALDAIAPGGGTPMGEAIQDAYDANYDYFANASNAEEAECAGKFIIVMTDGYPTGDDDWDRVNTPNDGVPQFNNTSNAFVDDDGWKNQNGTTDEYADDVAKWLYDENDNGWATYKHTVHSIGFTLQNPLLGDIADSSAGIYITAFNEGQLINAFHSLSLAMTEAQSFVAPVVSVDQANRTQSGDEIYTAFFRPMENEPWIGNLKKYGLRLMTRTECARSAAEWVVVGSDNQPAVDCYGNFYPNSKSIWSKVDDGGEAARGGVGALLKDAMPGPHPTQVPQGGGWWDFRNLYTYDTSTSSMVHFIRDNITSTSLGVADDVERDKVINYVYGYEYAVKDTSKGSPTYKREWVLGDMVHSEPTIIDYLGSTTDPKPRFIVAGANDGMLHVFTDRAITLTNAAAQATDYEPGREIWGFIPEDLLGNLKNFSDPSVHHYFVDGFSKFYRSQKKDAEGYYYKTLVFSERRGGNSYWALDVTKPNPMDWTVKWHIQGGGDPALNPYYELKQSWSQPMFARIQVKKVAGQETFKDVVIFAGGYDPLEDLYPEAWEDDDEDGVKDAGESHTDTAGGTASTYDYFNPDKDGYGRGIYVVDLETGDPVFRAVYAATDGDAQDPFHGNTWVYGRSAMKWSFPSDTAVVPLDLYYKTTTDFGYRNLLIYAPDVYSTIWKVVYTYDAKTDTEKWQVKPIFSANPGSNQTGAAQALSASPSTVSSDWGRKMFYPPDISYRGTSWTDHPTLFVGTGDRPHPRYVAFNSGTGAGYHDRFYVVADSEDPTIDDVTEGFSTLDETYLLNLTCDELEPAADVDQDDDLDDDDDDQRAAIRDTLFHIKRLVDDLDPYDCFDPDCDYPVNAQYARGWYRIIGKQGDCNQDNRDHTGEKVLSRPTLFAKVVYFTTFQPKFGDTCRPSGDALVYALKYDVGTAAFNLNQANDSGGDQVRDLSDTYGVVQNSTIASGVRVITRKGQAAGVFSAGGAIVGGGETDGYGKTTSIPGPPGGAARMMWETF